MTCFVAHLKKKGYFDGLGITVTKENARAIEKEIADMVGAKDGHCPEIWSGMKSWLDDPKKRIKLESRLVKKFAKPK
jgi:hypothetical protein